MKQRTFVARTALEEEADELDEEEADEFLKAYKVKRIAELKQRRKLRGETFGYLRGVDVDQYLDAIETPPGCYMVLHLYQSVGHHLTFPSPVL